MIAPLAHAGAGATWQALLSLMGLGLALVVMLAIAKRIPMSSPGDLILPLAGVGVLSSLSGTATSALSDAVWWAFPLGVVMLAAVVVAATTRMELGLTSPLLGASLVLSLVGVVVFDDPITRAWHPAAVAREFQTYSAEGLDLELVSPVEGASLAAGPVSVVVRLEGGTVGDGPVRDDIPLEATLADPTSEGYVQVFLDGIAVPGADGGPLRPDEDCAAGCTEATFTVPDVAAGTHRFIVEYKARDRIAFSPAAFQQAQVTITP